MAGGGLKPLTVDVQVLSPQLLDTLAEKFPQLERLKVDFAYLRSTDVPAGGIKSGLEDSTQNVYSPVSHSLFFPQADVSFRVDFVGHPIIPS